MNADEFKGWALGLIDAMWIFMEERDLELRQTSVGEYGLFTKEGQRMSDSLNVDEWKAAITEHAKYLIKKGDQK